MIRPAASIPDDAQPTDFWPAQLLELAAHVGPKAALQLAEAYGGRWLYVPADPASPQAVEIAELIGRAGAETLCRVYRRELITLPMAKNAIAQARRRPLVQAARAGRMSVSKAAALAGLPRTYFSELVHHSSEGREGAHELPKPADRFRQTELFDIEEKSRTVR